MEMDHLAASGEMEVYILFLVNTYVLDFKSGCSSKAHFRCLEH